MLTVPIVFNTDLLGLIGFNLGFAKARTVVLLVNVMATFISSVVIVRFLVKCVGGRSFGMFKCCEVILNVLIVLCTLFLT